MSRSRTILALFLPMVLLASFGVATPAHAASITACDIAANPATSFTKNPTAAPVTLRIGCAGDAGSLISLADSSSDLIIAFDFNQGDESDRVADLVDDIHDAQNDGQSLSHYFENERNPWDDALGLFPRTDLPDFTGAVYALDSTMAIVVAVPEVGTTANWWQKLLFWAAGEVVKYVVEGGCAATIPLLAPPLVPWIPTICIPFGGILGALTNELLNAAVDDRDWGGADVWAEAFAVAFGPEIATALWPKVMPWLKAAGGSIVTGLRRGLLAVAQKVGFLRDPIFELEGDLGGFELPLYNAVARRAHVDTYPTDWPAKVRVMIVGDSMTQGHEGDYTWRYRLWQWFTDNNISVDFVGPYTGTLPPDEPKAPAPPALQGSPAAAPGPPRTNGAYAEGVGFDSDHFGVWGRQAAQDKSLIRQMVATYQPDLLLVGLGFNDMGWFVSDAAGTLNSIRALVNEARAAKPGIDFALANVPQRRFINGRQDLVDNTDRYNAMLASAIPSWSTVASRVELVDWRGEYSCDVGGCPGGYDGLHPNALGEYQIAKAYETTLHDRLGLGGSPTAVPGQLPVRPTPVPSNVRAVSGPSGITVTWTPVFGALGYTVRNRIVGQAAWNESGAGAGRFDTTWTVEGLQWEYQVRTDNGDAVHSDWSAVVSAVSHPQTSPAPVGIVTRATATGIDLAWGTPTGPYAGTIDRYEVIVWDRDTPGAYIQTTGIRGLSAHIDGLVPGHKYQVWIATWNAAGGGLPGAARPVRIGAGTPAAPSGLTVVSTDPTTVQLSWNASGAAAGYRVWIRNINNGSVSAADESIVDGTSHGIAYLFPGVWNYEFCVTAVNGALESGKSNCVVAPRPAGS